MISFVGRVSYEANTGALPDGWSPGDLCIVHAQRTSATPASLATGFLDVRSDAGSSSLSSRIGYRILQEGDTNIGVWTNAVSVQAHVYHGIDQINPIGDTAEEHGNIGCKVSDLTLVVADGSSWVLWFGCADAGSGSGNNMHSRTHPDGDLTNRSDGATPHYMGSADTTGGVADWTGIADMVADNGTYQKQFYTIELRQGIEVIETDARITDDAAKFNRWFTEVDGEWRMTDTPDAQTGIVAFDLTREVHRIMHEG